MKHSTYEKVSRVLFLFPLSDKFRGGDSGNIKSTKNQRRLFKSFVFGKVKKGGMPMQEYREIDNRRYRINRVFISKKTTAELIEERIIKEKNIAQTLTNGGSVMYNMISGSIQSKEGL